MNKSVCKWTGVAVLAAIILATATYLAAWPTPASTQPKITWSPTGTEVILSPGESRGQGFTFTSDQPLESISIEAVPEIAPFLAINPAVMTNVPVGQSQSVQLAFTVPAGAALGTYEGTIHLRNGTATLPQTLKVVVNVWNEFRSASGGYSLKFPPDLELSTVDGQNISFATSSTRIAISAGAIETFDDISVVVEDNARQLPIAEFAALYDDGWFRNYRSGEQVTVADNSAFRYSDIGAAPGRAPMVAVFVDGGPHVFILSLGHYESPSSSSFVEVFDQIVSSFVVE